MLSKEMAEENLRETELEMMGTMVVKRMIGNSQLPNPPRRQQKPTMTTPTNNAGNIVYKINKTPVDETTPTHQK